MVPDHIDVPARNAREEVSNVHANQNLGTKVEPGIVQDRLPGHASEDICWEMKWSQKSIINAPLNNFKFARRVVNPANFWVDLFLLKRSDSLFLEKWFVVRSCGDGKGTQRAPAYSQQRFKAGQGDKIKSSWRTKAILIGILNVWHGVRAIQQGSAQLAQVPSSP